MPSRVILLMFLLCLSSLGARSAADQSLAWQVWESTLAATHAAANPYMETTVRVTYTHMSSLRSFSSYAFWDGGNVWKLACAFPEAGDWTWRTSASDSTDTGLHNRRGLVHVGSAAGTNLLYLHGFIQASTNGRHLVHADQTPFLWLGDTAWSAPQKATDAQWLAYLDDRTRLGYSVIQICPFLTWDNDPANRSGEVPFIEGDYSRLNPSYWSHLDRMIAAANDRGLLVMLVGLPGWQHFLSEDSQVPQRQAFVRQLAGRLYGRHVVFSPNSDAKPKPDRRAMAQELREATSRHPITQHCNTTPATAPFDLGADYYYDDACMTFSMYQSGHQNGNRALVAKQARALALALYRRSADRRLPIVNGEAYYEGDPRATGKNGIYTGTAADARLCAYSSILAGATAGFTNGIFGVWEWGMGRNGVAVPPETGMTRPSAAQIGHLGRLLRGTRWWTLEPASDLIANQDDDPLASMVFARDSGGTLGIAYLPGNAAITLRLSGFRGPLHSRWFDPVNGMFSPAAVLPDLHDTATLTPPLSPDHQDWVLLIESAPVS